MLRTLWLTNAGQTVMTYAIILAVVALALSVMQIYLRRGVQSGIKIAADELGLQKDSVETDPRKAFPSYSMQRSVTQAQRQTLEDLTGRHTLNVLETSATIYRESIGLIDWDEEE